MIIYEPIDKQRAKVIDTSLVPDYIHWFPGHGSVNLWHVTRAIIKVQSPEYALLKTDVILQFSDDSIFSFIDTHVVDSLGKDIVSKDDEGWDENNVRSTVLTKKFNKIPMGATMPVYIVAHAEEPGEFIDEIEIKIPQIDPHNPEPYIDVPGFSVGIEIEDEDEHLRINLQNMGVELSNDICRSLYSTDLYEERPDWAVLNTKWRELLNNYMDVVGCKGNYKSLVNSLQWFGYGDLVELRECWKHETEDGVKMADRPIHQELTDWYEQALGGIAKTTYMVLRQCSIDLNEQTGDELPHDPSEYAFDTENSNYQDRMEAFKVPKYKEYIYDPECLYPDEIQDHCIKWAKDEMRIKMALLGYYFETNFMPIHLDLLRSTVEDIVFDSPYNVQQAGAAELEVFDETSAQTFIVHPIGDDLEPDEQNFDIVVHLDQQEAYGFNHNTAPSTHINFGMNLGEPIEDSIIGVSEDFSELNVTLNQSSVPAYLDAIKLSQGLFNSIGAVAEFELITLTEVDHGKIITNISGHSEARDDASIYCEPRWYNVNTFGDIINYDDVAADVQVWDPNAIFYKQIAHEQYAECYADGTLKNDDRYPSVEELTALDPDGEWVEWSEEAASTPPDPDAPPRYYYKQTAKNLYVMVDGLGQNKGTEVYEYIPDGAVEWTSVLTYKRSLYCTTVRLLCQTPGEYWAIIELSNDDVDYAKKINIKVVDNLDVELVFYRLVYKTTQEDGVTYIPNGSTIGDKRFWHAMPNPFERPSLLKYRGRIEQEESDNGWVEAGLVRNMFEMTREGIIENYPDIADLIEQNSKNSNYDAASEDYTYEISTKYSEEYRHSIFVNLPCLGYELIVDRNNRPIVQDDQYVMSDFPRSSHMYFTYSEGGAKGWTPVAQPIQELAYYRLETGEPPEGNRLTTTSRYVRPDGAKINGLTIDEFNEANNTGTVETVAIVKKVFLPEWHKLVPIEPGEDVPRDYPIVCCPMISVGPENKKKFYWSYKLDRPAWEFKPKATGEKINPGFEAQQVFLANDYDQKMPLGSYDITFSWKWGDKTRSVTSHGPFTVTESVRKTVRPDVNEDEDGRE